MIRRFYLVAIFIVVAVAAFTVFVAVEKAMTPTFAPTNPREWQNTAPRG